MKQIIALLALLVTLSAHAQKQINLGKFNIPSANYSGITPIGENRYAIIDDKAPKAGWIELELQFSETGKLEQANILEKKESEGKRDQEGIAYNPATQKIYIAAEDDQRILEYAADGTPTGRELQIPEFATKSHIQLNAGFESLTYNASTHTFWTVTECNLKEDEEGHLRLLAFNDSLTLTTQNPQPTTQYSYTLDAPIAKKTGRNYVHGISDLCALDDGTLLVLEREFYVAKKFLGSFVNHKLYRVNPAEELQPGASLSKQLVTEFKTKLTASKKNIANYEGMCLGPVINGKQTVILISDSQAGYGNSLFHLKDYLKLIIF